MEPNGRGRFGDDGGGQNPGYVSRQPHGRKNFAPPPRLELYSDMPLYDISMVMQLLNVRQLTLWTWEQQLGIPFGGRPDRGAGTARRYSERDVMALKWLCEQIVVGEQPYDAAERLIAAQPQHILGPQLPNHPRDGRGPLTGPLTGNLREPGPGVRRNPATTRRLTELHDDLAALEVANAQYNTQLGVAAQPTQSAPQRAGGETRDLSHFATPPAMPYSGPLPPGAETGLLGVSVPGATSPAVTSSAANRDLRSLGPQLLRAFGAFDTRAANDILRDAFTVYPVERICVGLLLPALQRMGDLWAKNALDAPEERFAVSYVRGFLYSVFHTTMELPNWPLVMVACGPRETYDVYALTQAVFWRRAKLRVIYLGPDVNPLALPSQIERAHPALLALSVVAPQRVRALSKLMKDLQHLPAPRPVYAFSGPVFLRNQELQHKVSGVYLGDEIPPMTGYIKRLVGADDGAFSLR